MKSISNSKHCLQFLCKQQNNFPFEYIILKLSFDYNYITDRLRYPYYSSTPLHKCTFLACDIEQTG